MAVSCFGVVSVCARGLRFAGVFVGSSAFPCPSVRNKATNDLFVMFGAVCRQCCFRYCRNYSRDVNTVLNRECLRAEGLCIPWGLGPGVSLQVCSALCTCERQKFRAR